MIAIKNFVYNQERNFFQNVVQSFYRDSFSALYNLKIDDDGNKYLNHHENFLLPLLKRASNGFEPQLRYFYDVRTTEEYEQPALDYALLFSAGLKDVSPLSVKHNNGMTALKFAIQSALHDISQKDEPVLFCFSEFYHPYDKRYDNLYKACAFILLRDCNNADFVFDDKSMSCTENMSVFDFFAAFRNEKL